MPRFYASLSMLFTEVDSLERFNAAAKAGFTGVEYLFPYDVETETIKARPETNGLEQVLSDLSAGGQVKGERGIACHPDRVQGFREGANKVIAYAGALGNHQMSCLTGIRPQGHDCAGVEKTFVDNPRYAAGKLEAAGTRLVMKMINTLDVPGFYLQNTRQALEIRDEVGSANLFLQYDIYHIQVMKDGLAHTLENQLTVVDHVRLADNPGRHEPGTGEISYYLPFEHLGRIGCQGWIGCEYKPVATIEADLGWMKTRNVV